MPDISSPQEILFTRQRHEADRAGLHWDYRLVHGDKAYSWATKKELPEPGKSILLFEQPTHTSHYALSERVEIPKGSYGAGTTTLDFVRKAKLIPDEAEPCKLVIETKDGERFLLKQLPDGKYGDKTWLFKNLTKNTNMKKQAKLEQLENGLFYDDKTGRAEVSQAYHDAVYKKQVHPQALRHLAKGTAAFAGVGALTGGIAGRSLRGAAILGGVGGLAGLTMAHFGNKQQKSFRTQEALRDHIETDLYDEDYFGSPRRVKGPIHIQKSASITNKYLNRINPLLKQASEETHRSPSAGAITGGIVGGSLVTDAAIGVPQALVHKKAIADIYKDTSNKKEFVSTGDLKSFIRSNDLSKRINVDRTPSFMGPHLNPVNPHKGTSRGWSEYLGRSPFRNRDSADMTLGGARRTADPKSAIRNEVALHELGHAKDMKNFGSSSAKRALMYSTGVGRLLATPVGLAMAMSDKTEKYAPAVAAAPGILTMRHELTADYHAMNHLKQPAQKLSYAKSRALPTLTYALAAAAPALTAYAAGKIRHKIDGDKND